MPSKRKAIELPDGEMNLLTIDRVVERECECQQEHYVSCSKIIAGGLCGGTGKRKVRVRGWAHPYVNIISKEIANLWLMHDGKPIIEVEGLADTWSAYPRKWSPVHMAEEKFIKAIIAAHFAKTLPAGVAEIEECDAE